MKEQRYPKLVRTIDCTIAASLLLAGLLPALAAGIWHRILAQRVVQRQLARRADGTVFELMRWQGALLPASYLTLVNVILGDIALGGTGVVAHQHRKTVLHAGYQPSLVSVADMRSRTGMVSHRPVEFFHTRLPTYLGFLLRSALVYLFFRNTSSGSLAQFKLMGTTIANTTINEAVDLIVQPAEHFRSVAFVNAHSLNLAWADPAFRRTLNRFDVRLVDGSGVRLACQMRNIRLRDNVNGTDLLPHLAERCQRMRKRIFLYGSRPGIAATMADNLRLQFPGLCITGVLDGYGNRTPQDVIAHINDCQPDIVLVAMGSPLQEHWIQQWGPRCEGATLVAVGGLFDFYSGRAQRAPEWLRELGLEWTWRLLQEPGRLWKRYILGNPVFIARSLIALVFGRD